MDLVFDQGTVLFGDCVERLKELPDNCIDSIVTDPPYGLEFMGKDWDAPWKDARTDNRGIVNPAEWGGNQDSVSGGNAYSRSRVRHGHAASYKVNPAKTGQQFQAWCEQWAAECLRVLKPGGHILSFGGTRTYHRMVCAIEDAGFEVRDSIHWIYGCLTDDTEVLTPNGWRPGTDVVLGDSVAQWDPETGHITFVSVQDTFRAPWDGPMRTLRNADTDQVLTPNHRVYHQNWERTQRLGVRTGRWSDWRVTEANNIPLYGRVKLPVAGEHHGPGIGGEDYAALLGWVWTEGGFDLSGTGVRVYQSSVNPEKVAEIAALMDRMGDHKRYDRTRSYTYRDGRAKEYTETTWFFSGELALRVRADLPGKRPTYGLLERMTLSEKRALIRSAMLGDGSGWGTRAQQFSQKYEDDLIWFQTALALSGWSGKVAMRSNRLNGQLYLRRRDTTELQARHLRNATEHYQGEVWCIRVPSGAFVARRNGMVFITGNSGFPKSMDVSKAIAKSGQDGSEWQGWGTALKPAHEPIVLARKPLEGTVAKNVLKHGTGGLNIDGSRVGVARRVNPPCGVGAEAIETIGGGWSEDAQATEVEGRWPANVLLTHSAGCRQVGTRSVSTQGFSPNSPGVGAGMVYGGSTAYRQGAAQGYADENGREQIPSWECEPDCPVAAMDAQSDKNGASRFFQQPEWNPEYDVPFFYQAKASKKEREAGLENVDPQQQDESREVGKPGGDNPRNRGAKERLNFHPTVKPVALIRYLIRMVMPPDGIVLDPFMGSGTTAVAAIQEGFSFVGCEFTEDYLPIVQGRIEYALNPDPPQVVDDVSEPVLVPMKEDKVDLSSFQEMFPGLT